MLLSRQNPTSQFRKNHIKVWLLLEQDILAASSSIATYAKWTFLLRRLITIQSPTHETLEWKQSLPNTTSKVGQSIDLSNFLLHMSPLLIIGRDI